ncbi:DNA primase [hydrothermal vent metagenome]|uniref:DNA primase n=1 Tax=hydrothermal vent metagenome TaxID=652676 RepID=A0A3B1CBI8_9ZZZZ
MRIPEEQIDDIRNSADIVDIISGYVQLRKRGKNYIGLCPFHHEKTPSFTVSPDKQIYHCFGCHAGGNVFKFLMDYKNISFVESVQEIADYLGIKIKQDTTPFSDGNSELEELYDINVLAAKYFSNKLLKSDEGEVGRNYFKERNIKTQTQKIFGLGYAEPSWDNLLLYLKDNNVNLLKAKEIGLIDTRDDGTFYDKYRGRLMFPILSTNGRVIAFGGRIMNPEEKAAKYINSPESRIYSKRKTLYGLFHSKEEIRRIDKALLVEGYMDLISLHQFGIKNVVASSGTALTEEQVQLLSRFTKNITVLFDADAAGQKASMRSIEILLKQDFDVKLVTLPKGEDPDSFINKFGLDEFNSKINNAQNFLEYQAYQYELEGAFEDPTKQTTAIRELVKSAALVSDELKRQLFLKTIAKKFNLREKLLEKELDKFLSMNIQKENIAAQRSQRIKIPEPTRSVEQSVDTSSPNSLEKDIIELLLEGKQQIIELIFDHIHPDEIKNEKYRKVMEVIEGCYKNGNTSLSAILDKVKDEEIKTFISSFAVAQEPISKRWDNHYESGKIELNASLKAEDVVQKYRIARIDNMIRKNNNFIATHDDDEKIIELMKENQELEIQKKLILEGKGNSDLI